MNTTAFLVTLLGCFLLAKATEEQQQEEEEVEYEELGEVPVPRRLVTKSLVLNNGLPWGSWGPVEYCEDGSFAVDMEIKFEPYDLLDTDETALNAVKLYCATPDMHQRGYITSTEGANGQWQGMRFCEDGYLTGMRAQVLKSQGVIGDDVAVQNLEMECNYGPSTVVGVQGTAARFPKGDWSQWSRCANGSAICGIETRVEAVSLVNDDTGATDLTMFCCSLKD
ncbi:vitelline membrane outer layer protein 1-like [Panulirus ornatus]|uniref:vitelline membrane outer layer protein 1-like n=1 Tax=Panulirus ornatus TaxID=150431 RepID=UPI003A8B1A10